MNAATDRLCRLLGIQHGVIQAPMAGVQDAALTIASCNAGALGSLPCAMLTADTAAYCPVARGC